MPAQACLSQHACSSMPAQAFHVAQFTHRHHRHHHTPSPQRSARRRAVQQPECVVVLDHRGKTDANVLVETFELKNVQLAAHKFDHVEPSPHEEDLHRAHHDGPSADLQAIRVPLHLHLLAYVAERILEFSACSGQSRGGVESRKCQVSNYAQVRATMGVGSEGLVRCGRRRFEPEPLVCLVCQPNRWRASNPMAPLAPLRRPHHKPPPPLSPPHDLPSHALLTCIG